MRRTNNPARTGKRRRPKFTVGQRVQVSPRSRIKDTHGLQGTVELTWRTVFGHQWVVMSVDHNSDLTAPARDLDLIAEDGPRHPVGR